MSRRKSVSDLKSARDTPLPLASGALKLISFLTFPQTDSGLVVASSAVVEIPADARKKPHKKRKAKKQSKMDESLPSNLVEEEFGADVGEETTVAATETTSEITNVCGIGTSFDSSSTRSLCVVDLAKDSVRTRQQFSVDLLVYVCSSSH